MGIVIGLTSMVLIETLLLVVQVTIVKLLFLGKLRVGA